MKCIVNTAKWTPKKLLLSLWYNTKPDTPEPTEEELEECINGNNFLYSYDKKLEISFSKWPVIDYEKYNSKFGDGMFQKVVKETSIFPRLLTLVQGRI